MRDKRDFKVIRLHIFILHSISEIISTPLVSHTSQQGMTTSHHLFHYLDLNLTEDLITRRGRFGESLPFSTYLSVVILLKIQVSPLLRLF